MARIRRNSGRAALSLTLALAVVATACGGDDDAEPDSAEVEQVSLRERLTTIDDAVSVWAEADSIETAHAAAEAASNLVVGAIGPGYGDLDANGVVDGETEIGILPSVDGDPAGLALPLADNECVVADVLGGAWDDPGARWTEMINAIDDWRPDNNTMPSLASHPMRIVGWATFTLASDSIDEAHEYAGHAQLHVDTSLDALDC